jgi:hypothetical protein
MLRERLSDALRKQGIKRKKWNIDKLRNEENLNLYQQKINEKLEDIDGTQDVQKGKRNEEWFDEECRTAIQEKNNMRKIMSQRMTRNSKKIYREHRRRANKICQEKKREMLKRQMENIEVDRYRADTRKYYQTEPIQERFSTPSECL